MKLLLERDFEFVNDKKNPLRPILILLGYYKDEAVVDRLIKESKNMQDFSSINEYYDHPLIYQTIEQHRTKLLNFQKQLIDEGLFQESKYISDIRNKAVEELYGQR